MRSTVMLPNVMTAAKAGKRRRRKIKRKIFLIRSLPGTMRKTEGFLRQMRKAKSFRRKK